MKKLIDTPLFSKKDNDFRTGLLLLTPVLLVLVCIIFIPGVIAGGLSFFKYRLGERPEFIGIKNYQYLFKNVDFILSIVRTIIFVVITVFFQVVLGISLALLLAKKFHLQKFWVACLLTPMAICPSVAAVIWSYLLNYNIGPINYLLGLVGIPRAQWLSHPTLAFVSICFVYIWQSTPHVLIALYPTRLTIPEPLYEAAHLDGASGWQCFWNITLPLMKPIIIIMAIFRIMIALRNFGLVWTLTKGGPNKATELVSVYLYNEGFRYWRFGSASAVAVIMILITLLISSKYIKSMQENTFGK